MMVNLNDQNFNEFIKKTDKLILIDFKADWCWPCKMLSPLIAKIAVDFEGKIEVGELNLDESPLIANFYKVNAIPCLIFFKKGEEVKRLVGLQPMKVIVEELNKLLNENKN